MTGHKEKMVQPSYLTFPTRLLHNYRDPASRLNVVCMMRADCVAQCRRYRSSGVQLPGSLALRQLRQAQACEGAA